ncbi:MAG: F0F1 ATP synthase subunit B [Elusimicrobia bacterium]|nr:F0F1 ATP synthase subunit B [Elusimicrobiota bacterium]
MQNLIYPDIGLMFWTIITFLLLVIILGKFAWGPVIKLLDERDKKMSAERAAAEQAREAAENIRAELESRLSLVAEQAKSEIRKAAQDGEKEKDGIIAQAREEAKLAVREAKREIETERKKLSAELKNELAGLSLLAAEKLIGRQLDKQANKEIVENMLKELDKK